MDDFIDTEFETLHNDTPQEIQEDTSKIDKCADFFVALVLTFGQLFLAAVLVAFGVSAVPAFPFSARLVLKTFVLFCGLKFAVAGFRVKHL